MLGQSISQLITAAVRTAAEEALTHHCHPFFCQLSHSLLRDVIIINGPEQQLEEAQRERADSDFPATQAASVRFPSDACRGLGPPQQGLVQCSIRLLVVCVHIQLGPYSRHFEFKFSGRVFGLELGLPVLVACSRDGFRCTLF